MKPENYQEAKKIFDRISVLDRQMVRIKTLLTCNDLSVRINGTSKTDKLCKGVPKELLKEEDYHSDNHNYILILLENDLGRISVEKEILQKQFDQL